MADSLADQLRASSLADNNGASTSEDWKKNLNLPARDARQQTEVGLLCARRACPRPESAHVLSFHLTLNLSHPSRMLQTPKAWNGRNLP